MFLILFEKEKEREERGRRRRRKKGKKEKSRQGFFQTENDDIYHPDDNFIYFVLFFFSNSFLFLFLFFFSLYFFFLFFFFFFLKVEFSEQTHSYFAPHLPNIILKTLLPFSQRITVTPREREYCVVFCIFFCIFKRSLDKKNTKNKRAHPDLNRGPIDLQSIALPLSYRPNWVEIYFTTTVKK